MRFFKFLQPVPFIPQIQDRKIVKKKYFYWRLRILFGMYFGYAFFYFSRKSFTFAMPIMASSLGLNKAQLGILATILSLTYGASKFFSGIISDKSNPRYFMGIGLLLTGVFNIFFGLSSSMILFAIFWGLNGWFQGWGWPPVAKLLTHWYSQSERGRWWSIWNTSHNIGGAIIPIIGSIIAQGMGWRYSMYFPGISCILMGLFVIYTLRDTPQSLGLPPIEIFRKDKAEAKHSDSDKLDLPAKTILIDYVLKNKYIWILASSYFFIYIIRTAFNDWTVMFLMEEKGYSIIAASTTIFWFEIGGFLGSLFAGWSSDFVFHGKRNPVNVLFTLFVTFSILALWKIPAMNLAVQSLLLFFIGFFVFGPQMLIGLAAAELSHKKAAGTATGFVGWFAYAGAAVAGAPLGAIAHDWGWEGFFVILTACGIIALLILIPIWGIKYNPKHVKT